MPVSITAIDLSHLLQSGATNGQVPQWNSSSGVWVPVTVSGGGGISGSGTSGQVTYWNGTSSVTGSPNFTFDGTNLILTNDGYANNFVVSPNTGTIEWSSSTTLGATANGTLQVTSSSGGFGTLLLGAAGSTTGIEFVSGNGLVNILTGSGGNAITQSSVFRATTNFISSGLGSATSPVYTNNTNGNTGVYFPTSTQVAITTNGAQALFVDSTQNTTLAANLTVDGYAALKEISAPSSTSGFGKLYSNSADHNLYYLTGTGTTYQVTPLNTGTVTSVGLTVPSFLSVSGSPVTTSGTLAVSLSGTALPTTSGGTGLTSFTSEGVLYASSASALSQVTVNSTATNKYLQQVSSGAPSFAQVGFGDLSGTASLSQISSSGAATNNVITWNGTNVVWAAGGGGGGGISGSGVANQVTYWNGTSSVTGNANLTTDGSNVFQDGYYYFQSLTSSPSSISNGGIVYSNRASNGLDGYADNCVYIDNNGNSNYLGGYSHNRFYWDDDFWNYDNNNTASSNATFNNWSVFGSGTGAGININNSSSSSNASGNHPGIATFTTGTTSTGSIALVSAIHSTVGGGGLIKMEWTVCIPTLSNGTDTFFFQCGGTNSATGATGTSYTQGFSFTYTSTALSGNWGYQTAGNSTSNDTGIAVVAGTWYRLTQVVNPANSQIQFYINGSLVGTISSGLPTGSYGPGAVIVKSAGTTARTALIDRFAIEGWVNRSAA